MIKMDLGFDIILGLSPLPLNSTVKIRPVQYGIVM